MTRQHIVQVIMVCVVVFSSPRLTHIEMSRCFSVPRPQHMLTPQTRFRSHPATHHPHDSSHSDFRLDRAQNRQTHHQMVSHSFSLRAEQASHSFITVLYIPVSDHTKHHRTSKSVFRSPRGDRSACALQGLLCVEGRRMRRIKR